ncbi:amidohydrolase [Marivirga sericea]|uniref:Amidohydrolase n=2 Tax=Marivirga sericea TaxID=1028 RepID=A0A1X7K610_9BACT|nr:amidohydrolase [Marivirga sericea]
MLINMNLRGWFILLMLSFTILNGCINKNESNNYLRIEKTTDEIRTKLVALRRDFHENPELAGNEVRSAKIIAKYLEELGLEVKTDIAGNGVIGILHGESAGRNIAWRADMDALPNDFLDDVPFKSKNEGVQHGCGHDVHMAIGLGIAEVLAKNRDLLSGTIYFIFQPEEEPFKGAKNIVQTKDFLNMNLDEIYTLHVTALPVGKIMTKANELYAYQKRIKLSFKKSISQKELKDLYEKIRIETLRTVDGNKPWEIPLAFDTTRGLSNANTMFKDYFFMEENFVIHEESNQWELLADAYETKKSNVSNILSNIIEVINSSGYEDKFISASFIQENPTVMNDEKLTSETSRFLENRFGSELLMQDYGQIPYFNDDFIYFQEKIPGVYFLLGGSNKEKEINAMNHAPNFRVDEECIRVGVKTFSSLMLNRAESEK